MDFKIDENLPSEFALTLHGAGHGADTVRDQGLSGTTDELLIAKCKSENRVLITLDVGFSNIGAYPPQEHIGIIVLRIRNQGKKSVIDVLSRLLPALRAENPDRHLWIVEEDSIRVRGIDGGG